MRKKYLHTNLIMGVNAGQELPCLSSTHAPKAAQGCSHSCRGHLCPAEQVPVLMGATGAFARLWWAQWWETPEGKVLPVQLSCPGLAPVDSGLMGASPRRLHLLWDHFQLPLDLRAAAGTKHTQARLEMRFAWSLQGLWREPKARQPSLALWCVTFEQNCFCAWLILGHAWNMWTCWQHLYHNCKAFNKHLIWIINVQIPPKYLCVINPIIYLSISCKFINTALRRWLLHSCCNKVSFVGKIYRLIWRGFSCWRGASRGSYMMLSCSRQGI